MCGYPNDFHLQVSGKIISKGYYYNNQKSVHQLLIILYTLAKNF